MCMHYCEFWTWRLTSGAIAVACIILGFIYGPYQTLAYFIDVRPENDKTIQKETNLAIFLWSIVGLMWYICISNVFLLLACSRRSVRLINLYIVLTMLQLTATFFFCLRYLILCAVMDKYCFDHGKRQDNDVGAAIGIMVTDLCYIAIGTVVLFAVCNYKLTLQ